MAPLSLSHTHWVVAYFDTKKNQKKSKTSCQQKVDKNYPLKLLKNTFFLFFLRISKSQYFFPILIIITFCCQKLFWPFTVCINSSSDLKNFANSWPSASNSKSFSQSLEQFILAVGQNNFVNKIPLFFLCFCVQTACFEIWLNCI